MKIGAMIMAVFVGMSAVAAQPIKTTVATYSNNAEGVIIIHVDDGAQSSIDNALPMVVKHQIPATFFPIWRADFFSVNFEQWQKYVDENPGIVVLGNHTYSHDHFVTPESAEADARKGDAEVRKMMKIDNKALIAFCAPGGVKWEIPENKRPEVMEKFNNIVRYSHMGNVAGDKPSQLRTFGDIVMIIDQAEENGSIETILFHGVGGDWFNFPAEDFDLALGELAARRESGKIWVAPFINVYKYEQQRENAQIASEISGNKITVKVQCKTKIEQYDEPLTLITELPKNFGEKLVVSQKCGKDDSKDCEYRIEGGKAIYNITPCASSVITIIFK